MVHQLTMRMRPLLSPKLVRIAQVAVLLGLAVLLWRAVDGAEALTLLQRADPRWLVAAALVLTLQTVLSAQRWRITAAQLGITIPAGTAVQEYYLSQVVNQSLPGGVIGDASRAVRARGAAGLLISGQAVLFERLAGQLGLLALLVTGLTLTIFLPTGLLWPAWVTPALLVLLTCVPIGLALARQRISAADTALRRVAQRFAHTIFGRDVWLKQSSLSLATALCNVAAFAMCAAALDVALPILASLTLVPLILFAMVLPLSIGGWGLREGAAALLFPIIGASPSEGLITSIAFGLVFLCTVLPGFLLPLLRPNAPVL